MPGGCGAGAGGLARAGCGARRDRIGSFLFHTLATGWAALADTLPILLFILGYLIVFAHRFAGLPWSRAWLTVPAFLVLAAAVGVAAARTELPVPGLYLPALLGLAGLTG